MVNYVLQNSILYIYMLYYGLFYSILYIYMLYYGLLQLSPMSTVTVLQLAPMLLQPTRTGGKL